MPFSLVPTPLIEALLIGSSDNEAHKEYLRLRDVECHLMTHYVAVMKQNEATHAGLDLLIGKIQPDPPPQLPRSRFE